MRSSLASCSGLIEWNWVCELDIGKEDLTWLREGPYLGDLLLKFALYPFAGGRAKRPAQLFIGDKLVTGKGGVGSLGLVFFLEHLI